MLTRMNPLEASASEPAAETRTDVAVERPSPGEGGSAGASSGARDGPET